METTSIDEIAIRALTATELLDVDLLIIGGGPAGLSAGIYAERNGIKTVIMDKGKVGGQVLDTTTVENYPGMKKVSGMALAEIMSAHALEYVSIFEDEAVIDIVPGSPFMLFTDRHMVQAKAIIIATGAKRRPLGLAEEKDYWGKGLSYSPTKDGPDFIGKRAVIVGGGDSAVTEALYLSEIGVDITLVHRSDRLDAQQALVDRLHDQKVPVLFNTEVIKMKGKNMLQSLVVANNLTGQTRRLPVDGLFVSIGYVPAFELAEKLGLDLTADRYVQHSSCKTAIPGLYVAGDITGGYKQIVTASGQGAEAALTVYKDLKNGII